MRYLPSVLVYVALAACGSSKDKAPEATPGTPDPGGSGGGTATARPATLDIFINDTRVQQATAAQLAGWPRLDTLVPQEDRRLGQWGAITLTTADATPVELSKPFDTYPDMIPAVYPIGGGFGFGMFDAVELAKKGTSAMHQEGVRAIHIMIANNGHGGNDDNDEVGDPTKLVLTFKLAAGDTTLPGDKLLAIPREVAPGGKGESKGWKLAVLLDAAGVKTFDKLLLTDATGTNLNIEKADFDDKTLIPFVKLNKKGKLRFDVYKKKGEGWVPASGLRALASVQVVK